VAGEVRPLVRKLHYDPPPAGAHLSTPAARGGRSILISANEARTLLRAAQPFPQSAKPVREQHAAMLAALSTFAAMLLEANDPIGGGEAATAAALGLLETTRAWIAAQRWKQATSGAGVSWQAPKRPTEPATAAPRDDGVQNPAMFDDPPSPRRRGRKRRPADVPVQRSLFLPIPGPAGAATADAVAADATASARATRSA
jgi:hypothetical protein